MRISENILFLLTAASSLFSCVSDDVSECLYPCSFAFQYSENAEGENDFSAHVENVHILIYDDMDKLIKKDIVQSSNLTDKLVYTTYLPTGVYTAVSWGGMSDSYQYMKEDNLSTGFFTLVDSSSVVTSRPATHNFYARNDNVTVNVLTTRSARPIYTTVYTKNSNDVKVNLHLVGAGSVGVDLSTFDCILTSKNGCYSFENKVVSEKTTSYLGRREVDEGVLVTDFRVMRLWQGDFSRLLLNQNIQGKSRQLINESLTELILSNPALDLTGSHDFDIDIFLRYSSTFVSIIVKVNDWIVINTVEDLV